MKASSVNPTMHRRLTRVALSVVIVPLLVALAACGDDSEGGGTTSAAKNERETKSVTVGQIPIAGNAVVEIAQREGFFEEEGLDVKIENAANFDTVIPGVVGGTYNFGYQAGGAIAAAVAKDLPVAIVANGYFHDQEQQLMTKAGGPIKSYKDLEGKTVARGGLNDNYQAGIYTLLEEAGVDPESVKFVSMDTAQIPALTASGKVAAGQVNEPFITTSGDSITPLDDPLEVFGESAANAYMMVNTDWADDNKDTVERFLRAFNKAQRLAASDRKVVEDAVGSFTDIDPKILAEMNMPGFGPELHKESELEQQAAMYKYGFLDKPVKDEVWYTGVDIDSFAK